MKINVHGVIKLNEIAFALHLSHRAVPSFRAATATERTRVFLGGLGFALANGWFSYFRVLPGSTRNGTSTGRLRVGARSYLPPQMSTGDDAV